MLLCLTHSTHALLHLSFNKNLKCYAHMCQFVAFVENLYFQVIVLKFRIPV